MEKARLKYLLIWSGVNPVAVRRCFVVGSSNMYFTKLLIRGTFKFCHGFVRSCCTPVRLIAFLHSCGIAFITP